MKYNHGENREFIFNATLSVVNKDFTSKAKDVKTVLNDSSRTRPRTNNAGYTMRHISVYKLPGCGF